MRNKAGTVCQWSVDREGLKIEVKDARLLSLKDKRFIHQWQAVFKQLRQQAEMFPLSYQTISLIFRGPKDASLNFSISIPKNLDEWLLAVVIRYLSAEINNRIVTRGAKDLIVTSEIEGLSDALNKYFEEHYNNQKAVTKISEMVGSFFGAGRFRILKNKEVNEEPVKLSDVTEQREDSTIKNSLPVKIAGVSFGKIMTKIGIMEIDERGTYRHLSNPVSFRTWPEGSDRTDVLSLIKRAVVIMHKRLQEAGMTLEAIDYIGISVSVLVSHSNIVKVRTGFSAEFSSESMDELTQIKDAFSKEFPGKEIFIENDGNLEAFGISRRYGWRNALALKFGNTLSAGYIDKNGSIGNGVNEFTKVVVDFYDDAILHGLTKVRGVAGSYISWYGIENNARFLGMYKKYSFGEKDEVPRILCNWLENGNEKQKRDARLVFDNVGKWIASLAISLEGYYIIEHILLSGGILMGETGKVIAHSANKRLKSENKVKVVSDNETDLKYGCFAGLTYLAQELKGKCTDTISSPIDDSVLYDRIFKSDDIRGIAETELTDEVVLGIAQAFGVLVRRNKAESGIKIIVGRDGRLSSERIHRKAIEGLVSVGIDVLDIGFVTSGAFYYATAYFNSDA
ncbi:MAG: hypothetical protein AAB212_09950, partial [Bacteroidota bacterium]